MIIHYTKRLDIQIPQHIKYEDVRDVIVEENTVVLVVSGQDKIPVVGFDDYFEAETVAVEMARLLGL